MIDYLELFFCGITVIALLKLFSYSTVFRVWPWKLIYKWVLIFYKRALPEFVQQINLPKSFHVQHSLIIHTNHRIHFRCVYFREIINRSKMCAQWNMSKYLSEYSLFDNVIWLSSTFTSDMKLKFCRCKRYSQR